MVNSLSAAAVRLQWTVETWTPPESKTSCCVCFSSKMFQGKPVLKTIETASRRMIQIPENTSLETSIHIYKHVQHYHPIQSHVLDIPAFRFFFIWQKHPSSLRFNYLVVQFSLNWLAPPLQNTCWISPFRQTGKEKHTPTHPAHGSWYNSIPSRIPPDFKTFK